MLILFFTCFIICLFIVYIAHKKDFIKHTIHIPQKLTFLKVEEGKIVNESGNEIYLRGIQGFGAYPIDKLWYYNATVKRNEDPYKFDLYTTDLAQYTLTEYDLDELESLGANVVRMWLPYFAIQKRPLIGETDSPYEYSNVSLDLLENQINRFGERGIYTILVLSDVGQRPKPEISLQASLELSLWNKETGLWDQSVKLWGKVAEKLADNPNLAGYDLFNEPHAPSREVLHSIYQDYIDEIRKYDKKHIIFLEAEESTLSKMQKYQLGGRYSDGNIAASFHFYEPAPFSAPGGIDSLTNESRKSAYPGTFYKNIYFDKEKLEEYVLKALDFEDFQGLPVFVGEFGTISYRDKNQGGLEWTRDLMEIMNKYGIHYTFHTYKGKRLDGHGYWILKNKDILPKIRGVVKQLRDGTLKFEQVPDSAKKVLTTKQSYSQREGIREILLRGFSN